MINEEIVSGYGTRTPIDDKSKIVHKNNGEMLMSKSFAD
jgi:hypothetical protein